MRIGVDVMSWSRHRGAARVRRNVVGALLELDGECDYVLFVDAADPFETASSAVEVRATRIDGRPEGPPSRLGAIRRARAARAAGLDAFLFPNTRNWFPVVGTPTVVGVFDTIGHRMPEDQFTSRRAAAAWRVKQRLAVRSARTVFTISTAAQREVAEWSGIAPERIPVVPCAPDPALAPPPPGEVESALAELGLRPDGFVLYSSGINRRKSVETLIDAYARAQRVRDRPLVIVGEHTRRGYAAELRERAAGVADARRVMFPGLVPDRVLACLYAGAAVAVAPSLAEGFGMPAAEAAASGTAVIASDIAAHRETLDDAGIYFTPGSVSGLTRALDELFGDDSLRRERGEAAQAAVSRLSWAGSAARLQEILVAAARGDAEPAR